MTRRCRTVAIGHFARAAAGRWILLAASVAASCTSGEGSTGTGGAGAQTSTGSGGGGGAAAGGSSGGGASGSAGAAGVGSAGSTGTGGNTGVGATAGAGTGNTAGAGATGGDGGAGGAAGGGGGAGAGGGSAGTTGAAGRGGAGGTTGVAGRGGGGGTAGSGARGGTGGIAGIGGGGRGGATAGTGGSATGPFVCNQLTGGKLTMEWFAAGFENVVDNARWQVKWREDAYVEEWANAQSSFWTAQVDSACASNTNAPDRLVFGAVSFKYKTQAEWRTGITQAVNNIKARWPSVRRIDSRHPDSRAEQYELPDAAHGRRDDCGPAGAGRRHG